jgi:hypothetical protein
MVKKELGIRERRKVYEDAICVVAQSQKLGASSPTAMKERSVKNLIEKQNNRCVSILATVLGYRETSVMQDDGTKLTMLVPNDGDESCAIEKKKFEEIVQELPNNKELKEALWKAFVQRDQKSTEKFNSLIA